MVSLQHPTAGDAGGVHDRKLWQRQQGFLRRKTVALVGGSGSGKSTVISLLQRFYDPVEGEIHVDGVAIQRLQLKWLRSQMGLMSQEPALFATSIKENILFGREDASEEEVVEATKGIQMESALDCGSYK
ncbi:ATP-binding cassette [Vigna unguiculata]|uniref:ATP-binding cassette n=1 Tax=Vigna unguiculata TaxID=3917 RepID=A0A4D6LZP1_VIGUN|nr:ATP-binding cassette [Vigna unguiculata]